MIFRAELAQRFALAAPATDDAIKAAETALGGPLPADYVDLVREANGVHTAGNFSILGVEEIAQRNRDYEVADYLPGYLMIGDDGGGTAIVMRLRDRTIHEVEMGVMDEDDARLSAESLEQLLALGTSLAERGDAAL